MEKDLENRIERLCARYKQAAATVQLLSPVRTPSLKSWHRTESRAIDTVMSLRQSRKAPAGALIKLAYVRGLRSSKPNATLSQDHLKEVNYLEYRLNKDLSKIENGALHAFREHARKLRLADVMEQSGVPDTLVDACRAGAARYPLEQRARARVRVVVEMASAAGALAGTTAGSYDKAEDAA